MKKIRTFALFAVFLFVLTTCSQVVSPGNPELLISNLSLGRDSIAVYAPTGANFAQAPDFEVRVTNTGNQPLNGMRVVIVEDPAYPGDESLFSAAPETLPAVAPGQTTAFTVSFPDTTQGTDKHGAFLLVGNQNAAKKIRITYGEFGFTVDSALTLTENLLQVGYEGHTGSAVNSGNWTAGMPWFSSNSSVAEVDENTGTLRVTGAGSVVVGFISSESPLTVTGKTITVYPAPDALDPLYPVDSYRRLARPVGLRAAVLNLADITAAAGSNTIDFTRTGGGTVISAVDPATGELTFDGANGASSEVTVKLAIKASAPEGLKLTHQGSARFTASIGAAPAPVLVSMEPVYDDPAAALAVTGIKLTLSDAVVSGTGPANAGTGFTVTKTNPSAALTVSGAVLAGNVITLTLDPGSYVRHGSGVNVAYSGSNLTANLTALAAFSKPLAFTVYERGDRPYIKSAAVVDASGNAAAAPSNKLRVVFSEPVTIADVTKLKVKANLLPGFSVGGNPLLDTGARTYTLSAPAAVSGTNEAAWDFTMSSPAAWGEILRFSTDVEGAVINKSTTSAPNTNKLSPVPQFIVRNVVKRTRGSFENTPGFYKNGTFIALTGIADTTAAAGAADLYSKAIAYLQGASGIRADAAVSAAEGLGDTYTIVLGCDQTYAAATSFDATGAPAGKNPLIIVTSANSADKVITVTGTSNSALVLRNRVTLVIDEHVIFDGGGTARNQPLFQINDGGKVILDGGVIRNNVNSNTGDMGGAVRMGGGSNGTILLINSGEISGNSITSSGAGENGGSGGVYIYEAGAVIMHGGTIRNNSVTNGATAYRAGAVFGRGAHNATYFGRDVFFMTGGEISGNSVQGSSALPSAGAVLISGAFQKTGGTIYGTTGASANTTTWTGTVKAAVALPKNSGSASNLAVTAVKKRDATLGVNDRLFVERGSGDRNAPDWAGPDGWD
ncbi:MAG: hypothetical protein LBG84_08170 [Treponema sp.]|jgi:hypothetical protein|nr:hypothetical protein [Treponema sp.]